MDEVLEKLKSGIRRFRTGVYPAKAEQYQRAMAEAQQPSALIVTCADSRVHPDTLTQALPGEIFVTRNIGNMVPAHGEMMGAVSAVLEYAVTALRVRHVVVCGHTDCGAMKALLDPASVADMPTVKQWMTNAQAALGLAGGSTPEQLLQLRHRAERAAADAPCPHAPFGRGRPRSRAGSPSPAGSTTLRKARSGSAKDDGLGFVPLEAENEDARPPERVVQAALAAAIGEHE